MASSKPFKVDGLTVKEILDLGDDEIGRMSARELSRALRTVSLAANKRMNRLLQYSKKRHGQYVEKVDSPGLDLSALNHLEGKKFGVGDKSRNKMLEEFARARRFMNDKTSTVKGAMQSRKNKELALFGRTREEITKGMDKKQKKEKIKEINELMSDVYEAYSDFKDEYAMEGGYDKEKGRAVLQDIGRDMLEGVSPEAAKANAAAEQTRIYEEKQANEPDFWTEIQGETEWWEDI